MIHSLSKTIQDPKVTLKPEPEPFVNLSNQHVSCDCKKILE